MSRRKFLLTMVALAFLQGTFLPLEFLAGIFIYFYSLVEKQKAFAPVFLGGLIFDFVAPQALGSNALVFLLSSFTIIILSGKLPVRHPLFAGIFVFAFSLVRWQLSVGSVNLSPILLASLIAALLTARFAQDVSWKIKI